MGWWNTNTDGTSLLLENTGMQWGDGPADILSDAIIDINEQFQTSLGREPSRAELIAGMRFATALLPDDNDLPSDT
jgi:hypothetical protein